MKSFSFYLIDKKRKKSFNGKHERKIERKTMKQQKYLDSSEQLYFIVNLSITSLPIFITSPVFMIEFYADDDARL